MSQHPRSLYREALLCLARAPDHRGPMPHADRRGRAVNALCGDELLAELTLGQDDRIGELRCTVRGCAVAEASAHLLAELVPGADHQQIAGWQARFEAALTGAALPAELAPLEPLLALRERPSRHGCALLPWQALAEALRPVGVAPSRDDLGEAAQPPAGAASIGPVISTVGRQNR
ncbi:iron-sulfur cluster assembly scaffold protein [Sorangium sp. So ce327]|uniref:iron-sulfur cluster assembly scaffold protein n=1 Tax=Sorangium sp. So ce327 TaxID=3133301 RepID=UPI003F6319C1